MENVYTEAGGAVIGLWYLSFPFASLTVTSDQISLAVHTILFGKKEYLMAKDQIREITKFRGFFSSGVHFSVNDATTPEPLVFWTFGFANLKQKLESHGYTVSQ
jgi:hypothetical protein